MLIASVRTLLLRDLSALRREVEAYPEEPQLWACPPGISNAAGTLTLHCAGNLQHYIGARLGGPGYVRDRSAEFARRDVPREELLAEVDRALAAVEGALDRLDRATLPADYPEPVGGRTITTGLFLVHLATHLTYHLGQVDYHRRMVTGAGAIPGVVGIP